MSARRDELRSNIEDVEARISHAAQLSGRRREEITLIAVTKFFPVSDIEFLYESGIRNFGENRDEEGALKSQALPDDAIWHFQGQIQSKKVKSISRWADFIHSLDSISHAAKFDKELGELPGRKKFFVQVNLDPSRTDRGGLALESLEEFVSAVHEFQNLEIVGVMTVLPIELGAEIGFAKVKNFVDRLEIPLLSSFSMGMSGDFEQAIRAGATHIRVGSSILGSRPALA